MVKITMDMLLKHATHTKKRSNETDQQFFKRLTHIYLQEKNIDEIDNLSTCKNLSVLYLYDNQIPAIKNISFATNLTHLYLQKNKITRITGLKYLPNLTKLYLSFNGITIVEGLEDNLSLCELHIESQILPLGEKLLFDPSTMETLSKSLNVLNVSSNGLEDTSDLKMLHRLNHVMIENNQLSDMLDLSSSLMAWPLLHNLNIQGNPICDQRKFRDKLIIMSKSLVTIDEKEVFESTRQFLQKLYEKKQETKKQTRIRNSEHRIAANSSDIMSDRLYDRLSFHDPYSQSTLYKLEDSPHPYNLQQVYPLSSKHLSKNHRQFVEVLARVKDQRFLPPLEHSNANYDKPS